jgi:outer membrane protein assembly factor BamB
MSRIVITAVLCLLVNLQAADQWAQFRGPNAGVVADDPSLPDSWSESEHIVWKTQIPGLGWSSPIVWGDHVFLTTAISTGVEAPPTKGLYDPSEGHGKLRSPAPQKWIVYDVDFKTGKIRWQRELRSAVSPIAKHVKNSFASETAATDGERVYVSFATIGVLAAMDLNGQVAWTVDVGGLNGGLNGRSEYGTASSPVLHKDRLYLVNDNSTKSFLAAFDKKTGNELWRVSREENESWATPFIWENELRTEIVTAGTGKVRSYDLEGKLLWELKGMTILATPTPFTAHGLVYISSGYPGASPRPVYAIRPGASGDISLKAGETSNQHVVWYQPQLGTYNTSAIAYGDYFYTLLDRGFLLCHDAKTGKQIYGRQRISADASGFTASPWAYNGKIFLLSEDGDTFVVQAGAEYKVVGKNSMNEMTLATPAISRGSVFIRTQSKLYRIANQVAQ